MNDEDRKRLEEIIEAGKEGYCLTEYDSNWLISQLKAEAEEVKEDAGVMKVLRRRAEAAEADAAKWKLLIGPGGMNALAAAEAERNLLRGLLREVRRVMGNAALDDWTCQNDPDLEKDWNNLLARIDAARGEEP